MRAGRVSGEGGEDVRPKTASPASMTVAQIKAMRVRLKKLNKNGSHTDERKFRGVGIVRELFEEIAELRAAGWKWEAIKKEFGPEVGQWKSGTLSRYFQLIRKQSAASGHPTARPVADQPALSRKISRSGKSDGRSESRRRGGGRAVPDPNPPAPAETDKASGSSNTDPGEGDYNPMIRRTV